MEIKSNTPLQKIPEQTQPIKTQPTKIPEPEISAYQQSKKLQNFAVLDASLNINARKTSNKSVADNPMSLLYKTAIDEINKQLEPMLGKNATQSAYEENLDVSPQATASRIIQGSTAFYDAFKEQNSELNNEEALTEFLTVINSGIEKGFAEAKDILDSLSVLEGDIENNIDLTYDFVQQGFTDFKEQLIAGFANKSKP